MRVESLEIFSYNLKLKTPLIFKNASLESRQGVLLQVGDEQGRKVTCDIAPLPHFSPDSLSSSLDAYSQLKKELLNSYWSLKLLLSPNNILNQKLSPSLYPSLFFGIEFALLSLMMPSFSLSSKVKVNLLLMGSDEAILKKASIIADYEAIKLKVGIRSPEQTLELIHQITPYLNPSQKLRIDVNRAWTMKQTLFFCDHFPKHLCDYLEEPLQDPKEYLSFSNYCSYPIAFDESLLQQPLDYLLSIPTKKALIIKPSLLGSLQKMNLLYQKACKHKLQFILTSSFESGLGHLMIAHLSRFLAIESPIGLDTYNWFKEDVLSETLTFSKGSLVLPKENLIRPDLDFSKLTLIDA
ncbi:MAG: o-succinylbenzoate synthase [Chlamydiae bacterium]|nr:o-succinylbenzoate synthase [Chlamydiota bacterium]